MRKINIILCLFLIGMAKGDTNKADEKGWSEQGVQTISLANNKFAFNLYFRLKDKEDNIFLSPFSIFSALTVTYEGARGNTKKEIENAMGYPSLNSIRRANMAKIHNEINGKNKKYELYSANALWIQRNFSILKQYEEVVKRYYLVEIENLDFVREPEKSADIINSWVSERTGGRIKDLISKNAISSLTRLIITNAIYFKGKWLKQFNKDRTEEANFNISEDKKVKVQMMSMREQSFNYYEDDRVQILELPYDEKEISMLILLPKSFDITYIDEYLNSEKLEEIKSSFIEEKVNVYIPKFKLETKYLLKDVLYEMGMKDAFTTTADFSGITGKKELFISKVVHKAFVEVNEEGTEAAAATGVVMELTMVRPVKTFRADHPFVFMIYEKKYKTILFLGRVVNPSK